MSAADCLFLFIDGRFLGTLKIANHCTIFRGVSLPPRGLCKIVISGICTRNGPETGGPSVQKRISKADPAKGLKRQITLQGLKTFKPQDPRTKAPRFRARTNIACFLPRSRSTPRVHAAWTDPLRRSDQQLEAQGQVLPTRARLAPDCSKIHSDPCGKELQFRPRVQGALYRGETASNFVAHRPLVGRGSFVCGTNGAVQVLPEGHPKPGRRPGVAGDDADALLSKTLRSRWRRPKSGAASDAAARRV